MTGDGPSAAICEFDSFAVERLTSRLSALEHRVSLLADGPAHNRPATAPQPAKAVTEEPSETQSNGTGFEDNQEELKRLVIAVVEQERKERKARTEERLQELEELSQGPYEQYNYLVNRIGKELQLSDDQKEHYYELLNEYQQRLAEEMKSIDALSETATRGEGVGILQPRLATEILEEFAVVLSSEQERKYRELGYDGFSSFYPQASAFDLDVPDDMAGFDDEE